MGWREAPAAEAKRGDCDPALKNRRFGVLMRRFLTS
jgi:hypothetical protein